jgi:alcohol dehydrogenase
MSRDSRWTFRNPTRVVFGRGAVRDVADAASGRTLLICSPGATERGLTGRVATLIGAHRVLVHDRVESDPSVRSIDASIDQLRGEQVETIVAVGGGSAIDTGKVVSLALATGGARVSELVELDDRYAGTTPVPLVAVPTTAGTGSEVTPFATVWDTVERRKLSVGTPGLFPAVALVDPDLTASLGWEETLGPGLDAYVQCLEAIWNRNATTVTTALAAHGLALVPDALRELKADPVSLAAREDMAEAALLSGLAISQTRTALAHSMSYPISAHVGMPHGLACALVMPAVLEFNVEQDDGRLAGVARSAGLGRADALVASVTALYRDLAVADAVRRYLPDPGVLETLAPEMLLSGRADNNLRAADEDAVRVILRRTLELVAAEVVA